MLDYSATGMRAQVQIGTLSHEARVAWRDGNFAGINFIGEHHSIF